MPLPALASLDDLAVFVPKVTDDPVRAVRALELASAVIRRQTRQTITAVVADAITLLPQDGELVLPQRPVTAVTSVTINTIVQAASTYRWTAQGRLERDPHRHGMAIGWDLGWEPGGGHRLGWGHWPVDVVYDHGYPVDEVPDDLVAVNCSIAARLLDNPTGLTSESIEGYSRSFGQGLTTIPEDQILAAYRQPAGTTRVRR